jgi:cellulose biosynthesis protein BcsQ
LSRREFRLRERLTVLAAPYAFTIIDCPPSLSLLTVNALAAADGVLVPLQAEYYALEGLTALLDTIGRVRDALNPSLALEGLVLTMFDGRNTLAQQVQAEVRTHFGDGLPHRDSAQRAALGKPQPWALGPGIRPAIARRGRVPRARTRDRDAARTRRRRADAGGWGC